MWFLGGGLVLAGVLATVSPLIARFVSAGKIELTADEVRDLVERMLKSTGRRIDFSTPFVDAMLLDGSRLHVAIPDITRVNWAVNIRKFVVRASYLEDLVGFGTLTHQAARFLEASVISGLNVLVAGGTQSGNPTTRQYTLRAARGRPSSGRVGVSPERAPCVHDPQQMRPRQLVGGNAAKAHPPCPDLVELALSGARAS